MKGMIGLLVTAALGMGIYLYTLKQASPAPGMVITQAISTTGVQNDLVPYQQVLADYRASALSQVDRADIPDQQRQLVQQYFSDLGGQ